MQVYKMQVGKFILLLLFQWSRQDNGLKYQWERVKDQGVKTHFGNIMKMTGAGLNGDWFGGKVPYKVVERTGERIL